MLADIYVFFLSMNLRTHKREIFVNCCVYWIYDPVKNIQHGWSRTVLVDKVKGIVFFGQYGGQMIPANYSRQHSVRQYTRKGTVWLHCLHGYMRQV